MNDEEESLDRLAADIQRLLEEEALTVFSRKVIDEFNDPSNVGRMIGPDGFSVITGPCGDTMEFYMKVEDESIVEISFMTDGCGSTIACGSMLTRLAKGKSLEEALKITDPVLIEALDGLPPENVHCAKLAVDSLKACITDHLSGKREDRGVPVIRE